MLTCLLCGLVWIYQDSKPQQTLEVEVVDVDGEPVPEIPVSLVLWLPLAAENEPIQPSHMDRYLETTKTDEASGIARFRMDDSLQKNVPQWAKLVIRLGIPHRPLRQVEIPTDPWPKKPIRLELPAYGEIFVLAEGLDGGEVRMRATAKSGERSGLWNEDDACQIAIEDGQAIFPYVEIGHDYDYRFTMPGHVEEQSGSITGPNEAGDSVTLELRKFDTFPVITGRLLDAKSKPLASRKVWLGFLHLNSTVAIETDESGRLEVRYAEPAEGEKTIGLSLRLDVGTATLTSEVPQATVMMASEIKPGLNDLGDIFVLVPGCSDDMLVLDDDALEQRYSDVLKAAKLYSLHQPEFESLTAEMGQRGGARWIEFLRVKYKEAQQTEFRGFGNEVMYLTALRRAQRKTDPLTLNVSEDSQLEVAFPESPVVVFEVTNTDEEGETIPVTEGGSYRSGRFARCYVEAFRDGDGWVGQTVPSPSSFGGGMSSFRELAPGEFLPYAIPVTAYVELPSPGEYRVRISYHNDQDIDGAESLDGLILFKTRFIKVKVNPCQVTIDRRTHEKLKTAAQTFDTNGPVPLISAPTIMFPGAPDREFVFEGKMDAIDEIYMAGLNAIPALLEGLDSSEDSLRRQWILGMLWNLTGVLHPNDSESRGAIGNTAHIGRWRDSREKSLYGDQYGTSRGGGRVDAQRRLIEKWKDAEKWFQIEIVE